jgi:hypothetical protein
MPLIAAAIAKAYTYPDPLLCTTGQCGIIHLFFLLSPGKHVYSSSNNDNDTFPFRLMDIKFIIGEHCFNAVICNLDLLLSPRQVLLMFTKQQNGTIGERLKHSSTGHVIMSPVLAMLQ